MEFDFEGQWDLITELNWTGEKDSFLESTKKTLFCLHQNPAERSSGPTGG